MVLNLGGGRVVEARAHIGRESGDSDLTPARGRDVAAGSPRRWGPARPSVLDDLAGRKSGSSFAPPAPGAGRSASTRHKVPIPHPTVKAHQTPFGGHDTGGDGTRARGRRGRPTGRRDVTFRSSPSPGCRARAISASTGIGRPTRGRPTPGRPAAGRTARESVTHPAIMFDDLEEQVKSIFWNILKVSASSGSPRHDPDDLWHDCGRARSPARDAARRRRSGRASGLHRWPQDQQAGIGRGAAGAGRGGVIPNRGGRPGPGASGRRSGRGPRRARGRRGALRA